ncbi:MAG: hypothetical protein DMD35_01870 [Gemmatimonadetes bacterium]|nr:MAG: hypothetical protein DMD35_01870 [Gemmatimonadota bacterium]
MISDAQSHGNAMSISSEERRRTEAALVRAIDVSPYVGAERTRSAICAYVDVLADDGLLPEAVVIALKSTLSRAHSLDRLEPDAREEARSALVSACIQHYFARRIPDDVRFTKPRALRLVKDERDASVAPDQRSRPANPPR